MQIQCTSEVDAGRGGWLSVHSRVGQFRQRERGILTCMLHLAPLWCLVVPELTSLFFLGGGKWKFTQAISNILHKRLDKRQRQMCVWESVYVFIELPLVASQKNEWHLYLPLSSCKTTLFSLCVCVCVCPSFFIHMQHPVVSNAGSENSEEVVTKRGSV